MSNVTDFFLFRRVINETRAYLSPGRAQMICFESVPPPIALSVRNSNITFRESSRGVVYDSFFPLYSCIVHDNRSFFRR